jgi:hypothetical protein
MKKTVLLSFLILTIFSINAQNNDKINEIKFNGLFLVLGAVEVTYERILNEESGVGISLFLPFDEDVNADVNYYISPYYRVYFGKKYAAGFFLEGFGLLSSTDRYQYIPNNVDSLIEKNTDFALGIGFGGKWITKRGFLAELNFGVGRNLFNKDSVDDFVGKLAITLGYRF